MIFSGVSVCFAVLFAGGFAADAQGSGPSEYQLKAAFLYKFANFVVWPTNVFSEAGSPFIVGVLGKDPFGADLDATIVNQPLNGHRVAVRRLTSLAQARGCHMLFICNSERKRLEEILRAVRDDSILTVGEMDQFAARGGMIHLAVVEGKIRFEINLGAARRAGLRISSQLLNLATRVYEVQGEGRGG